MKHTLHVVKGIKSKRGYPYFNIINLKGLLRVLDTSETKKEKEHKRICEERSVKWFLNLFH